MTAVVVTMVVVVMIGDGGVDVEQHLVTCTATNSYVLSCSL